ncbi:hypothetical protein [Serratia sp. 2723]|uniref:hypothetical protein n=1 Tax=unclassified Serratia (in: enterobacteria) TaxID=2647522 RepID=UPI003D21F766
MTVVEFNTNKLKVLCGGNAMNQQELTFAAGCDYGEGNTVVISKIIGKSKIQIENYS